MTNWRPVKFYFLGVLILHFISYPLCVWTCPDAFDCSGFPGSLSGGLSPRGLVLMEIHDVFAYDLFCIIEIRESTWAS